MHIIPYPGSMTDVKGPLLSPTVFLHNETLSTVLKTFPCLADILQYTLEENRIALIILPFIKLSQAS